MVGFASMRLTVLAQAAAHSGTHWANIFTAIGTVGAVVVSLGIALMTEWRRSESEKQRELDAARNVIAVFETTHTGFGRPTSCVRVVTLPAVAVSASARRP